MNGNTYQMEGILQFCRREVFHGHQLSRYQLQRLADSA